MIDPLEAQGRIEWFEDLLYSNYQKHRERRLAQVNAWNARQREKRRQERERLEAFRQGWRDRLGKKDSPHERQ
jgi:hypothetical protein